MEDVNVTVDASVFTLVVISISPVVKTLLAIKLLVSVGVINPKLLSVDIAVSVLGVENDLFSCVEMLCSEASVITAVNVTVDVSVFTPVVISMLPVVKSLLAIKVLVSVGVINPELLSVDLAASVFKFGNVARAVADLLTLFVVVFKAVVDVGSVLVVVSSCVIAVSVLGVENDLFSCVEMLCSEASVITAVNVTVDVSVFTPVVISMLPVVKSLLAIKVLVSVGVINPELLSVDLAASVFKFGNVARAVADLLTLFVVVFKAVVDVGSVLVVVSSCVIAVSVLGVENDLFSCVEMLCSEASVMAAVNVTVDVSVFTPVVISMLPVVKSLLAIKVLVSVGGINPELLSVDLAASVFKFGKVARAVADLLTLFVVVFKAVVDVGSVLVVVSSCVETCVVAISANTDDVKTSMRGSTENCEK